MKTPALPEMVKSPGIETRMLFPTSGAARNEGACAIRACWRQAVIWIFFGKGRLGNWGANLKCNFVLNPG